jgi:hypothetical protein
MVSDVVKKRREFLFVDLFDSDDFDSGRRSVSIDCPRVDELPYRFGQLQRESLFFETSHSVPTSTASRRCQPCTALQSSHRTLPSEFANAPSHFGVRFLRELLPLAVLSLLLSPDGCRASGRAQIPPYATELRLLDVFPVKAAHFATHRCERYPHLGAPSIRSGQ